MENTSQMPSVLATMFSVVSDILDYQINVGSWSFTLWTVIKFSAIFYGIFKVIQISIKADEH